MLFLYSLAFRKIQHEIPVFLWCVTEPLKNESIEGLTTPKIEAKFIGRPFLENVHFYSVHNMSGSTFSKSDIQLLSDKEIWKFQEIFPKITRDVLDKVRLADPSSFTERHYAQLWVNNVPQGRKIRAEMLILAYKFFEHDLTEEKIRLSYILGWIVEIFHSADLVGFDRKNKLTALIGPCSCSCGKAVVDVSTVIRMNFLKNAAFILTKQYFGDKIYYSALMGLLHEANLKTSLGKRMDMMTQTTNENYSSCLSLNFYETVVNNKSYGSVYLPIALALVMGGIFNQNNSMAINNLAVKVGMYLEAQADFLDDFVSEETQGRTGDSIAHGKYTWSLVTAYERGNNLHRKMLLENYGHSETLKICVVKTLFERLGIKSLYWTYEYETRQKIRNEIENLPEEIPKPLFQILMASIYARWQ
ncbi:unnamed protein product [Allacma fusca]|uniref:Uncharacterized protein n=1 Tax=Allacma fusca TaxID=39272 RepID=A0A8J2NQJ6_9HEXA|nr:unnamed protein product [Allacma fusca]